MPTTEETAAADKAAADKAAADKAANDKAAADKAAADKAAADAAAAKGAEGTTDADKAAAAAAKKKADDDAAAAAAAAERKAPAKYELKAPENSLVDMARIEALARENNLPNEDAQALVEAIHADLVKQSESWAAELKADKTYGGDKLEETQRLANLVLDKVRPKGSARGDAFRKMLSTGYGNNLEVASFLADLGKMLKEDAGPGAGEVSHGGTKPPIEKRMYPNAKS